MGNLSKSLVGKTVIVLFLCTISLAIVSKFSFDRLHLALSEIEKKEAMILKEEKILFQVKNLFTSQVHAWKNLLIRGKNKEDYEKYIKKVLNSEPKIKQGVDKILEKEISKDITKLFERFQDDYKKMMVSYRNGLKVFLETKDMTKTDNLVKGVDREPEILLEKAMGLMIDHLDEFLHTADKKIEKEIFEAFLKIFIISLLGFLAIVILITFKVREIKRVASIAGSWAKGDLSKVLKVESTDEVGMLSSSFGAVREYLVGLIEEVGIGARKIDNVTTEIAALTNEHSANTNQQASTIGEFSTSITEITSMMTELGKATESISDEMETTNEMALKGKNLIAGTVENMDTIKESNSNSLDKFTILGEKVDEIAKIMVSITAIADKTNLLSVNASIEAVKAGELGKGFNVVATEIRRLADQTMLASNEINNTIQEIQKASSAAMMSMEKSTQTTELGMDRVKDAWESVEELVKNIIHISPQVFEMQNAIQQSVDGVTSAQEAIYQINEGAIESKNTAGQYSKSAADLGVMSKNQVEKISVFKIKE